MQKDGIYLNKDVRKAGAPVARYNIMDTTKAVSLPYAVKLIRMQSDDMLQFCDKSTNELVYFSEIELEMAQNFGSVVAYRSLEDEKMKRLIIASEFLSDPKRFIPLVRVSPDNYLEFVYSFIDKQNDPDIAKKLRSSVNSLFSFNKLKSFHKALVKLELEQRWNEHEEECFLGCARDWCEKHSLPYTYDMIEPTISLVHDEQNLKDSEQDFYEDEDEYDEESAPEIDN